jgi:hypothetical protein
MWVPISCCFAQCGLSGLARLPAQSSIIQVTTDLKCPAIVCASTHFPSTRLLIPRKGSLFNLLGIPEHHGTQTPNYKTIHGSLGVSSVLPPTLSDGIVLA